jgi:hypothetical protein
VAVTVVDALNGRATVAKTAANPAIDEWKEAISFFFKTKIDRTVERS